MATHNAETLEDGQFLISRQGHYWRVSFYWQGAKHTTCAWLSREQAEAEAHQRLRTLGGVSRAFRGLGGEYVSRSTKRKTSDPQSLESMSATHLRTLAGAYGVPRFSKMRRDQLIGTLRNLMREPRE